VQSYCGSLDFGLIAARHAVPDLDKFVRALHAAYDELTACSGTPAAVPSSPAARSPVARRRARAKS
jgi:hypothetical protein